MKAVILVAGMSTRLRPLTDSRPKSLLPVAGVPILRRALTHLRAAGIEQFIFVTGYLRPMIQDAVQAWFPTTSCQFFVNEDYATTQNAYSLLLARSAAEGHDLVVLDGDVVFEAPVVERLLASEHADCLALRTAGEIGEEEVKVALCGDGRVRAISGLRKVTVAEAAGESIGIERFSAAASIELFATLHRRLIVDGGRREWREHSYQDMIDRGAAIYATDVGGAYCAEIDTPEDLAAADKELSARPSESPRRLP